MESPFKGKTGLRRIWNAFFYSMDGFAAAYRNEDAFRQEAWLAALLPPDGESGLRVALLLCAAIPVVFGLSVARMRRREPALEVRPG